MRSAHCVAGSSSLRNSAICSRAAARRWPISAPTPFRIPSCTTRHASLRRTLLHSNPSGKEPQVEVVVEQEEEQFSPYLDSMLRSFALGVGAGVLFELGHVLFQCAAVGPSLPDLVPDATAMVELLAPLRLWDNLVAMTGTFVFYVAEVAAVMAVLRQYPNDNKSACRALQSNITLSKRLLPLSLTDARRALYLFMTGRSLQPSTASAFNPVRGKDTLSPSSASDAPPTALASAAVLERPPTSLPLPPATLPPSTRSRTTDQLLDSLRTPTHPKRPLSPGSPPASTRKEKTPSRPTLKKLPGVKPPRPPPAGGPPAAKGSSLGRLEPATASFLAGAPTRAKVLSERQAYLKDFWYAAALSSSLLPGKPLEVPILGRTVVLFRDAATGKPMCLDNVCPHRGAPLGKGWLQQLPARDVGCASQPSASRPHAAAATCITCPYHGWAFDGGGVLTNVPSQDDQDALPRRSLLDSYPVEERGGFVWLFFGSSRLPAELRPPIPSCPELEDPSWTKVYGEIEFRAPHWGVFDNLMDMTHVHYVHDDSFGNKDKPMIRDMEVTVGDYSITANFRIHNKPASALWGWTATESVPIQASAHLPSSSMVKNFLGAGVSMVVFINTVPISAERSAVRFCHIRNFAGWEGLDALARAAMVKILKEDKAVVEALRPEAVRHEVSLQADMPQVAFRKLRQRWVDAGYAVDPEDTRRFSGSLDM